MCRKDVRQRKEDEEGGVLYLASFHAPLSRKDANGERRAVRRNENICLPTFKTIDEFI